MDATTQEEAAVPVRLLLIYSFSAKSPAALHGMHLLGAGDVDLAQIESLVKVRDAFLNHRSSLTSPTGGRKVRARDIYCVKRKVKRRGNTPHRQSTVEVFVFFCTISDIRGPSSLLFRDLYERLKTFAI